MAWAFNPVTFDGVDLTLTPFTDVYFTWQDAPMAAFDREPVELKIPGDYSFPQVARSQVGKSTYLNLYMTLVDDTKTTLNIVRRLFDRYKGDVTFVVNDSDGLGWQTTVRVVELRERFFKNFVARLHLPRPIWERTSNSTDGPRTLTASPLSYDLSPSVNGIVRAYPEITLQPTVAKGSAADFRFRRRSVIAWCSELPGEDSVGNGYPIDIANDSFDTQAEITATRMQADGDDLRVYVDGVEYPRALDGINTTTTKVWVPIHFSPGLSVALAAASGAGTPATGSTWAVNDVNVDSLEGWPAQGVFLVDNEAVWYGRRTDTEFQLIERDYWNTSGAAHSAGATGRWVEHDIQMVYGNSALTAPTPTPQFAISTALSTNLAHTYADNVASAMLASTQYGQPRPLFTEDNIKSAFLSIFSNTVHGFVDKPAGSGVYYPYNNLEFYVPCGVKAAASALAYDVSGGDIGSLAPGSDIALDLRVFGTDIATGVERLLATYKKVDRTGGKTLTPDAALSRIRLNAIYTVVTGAWNASGTKTDYQLALNGYNSNDEDAQAITIDSDFDLYGIAFLGKESASGDTRDAFTAIRAAASGTPTGADEMVVKQILNAKFSTSYTWVYTDAFSAGLVRIQAGFKFLIVTGGSGGAGIIYMGGRENMYADGSKWRETAGSWANDGAKDLFFLLLGDGSVVQPEAPSGMEGYASVDNIVITFDNSTPRTPTILLPAREDIYPIRDRIEHVDLGTYIDVFYIAAINETLTIRCKTKEVILNEARKQYAPAAVTPSDPEQWLYLRGTGVAADNTLRHTEAGVGGGSSMNITTVWPDSWG